MRCARVEYCASRLLERRAVPCGCARRHAAEAGREAAGRAGSGDDAGAGGPELESAHPHRADRAHRDRARARRRRRHRLLPLQERQGRERVKRRYVKRRSAAQASSSI